MTQNLLISNTKKLYYTNFNSRNIIEINNCTVYSQLVCDCITRYCGTRGPPYLDMHHAYSGPMKIAEAAAAA